MALLEADVALPVVKEFIGAVRVKAIGQEVAGSLTPGQALIGVVQRELAGLMGGAAVPLNFATTPPAVVLLAGLQGAGKTTSAAKLARLVKEDLKKKVLLVSCDVYRPAAIAQLQTLAAQVGTEYSMRCTEYRVAIGSSPGRLNFGTATPPNASSELFANSATNATAENAEFRPLLYNPNHLASAAHMP